MTQDRRVDDVIPPRTSAAPAKRSNARWVVLALLFGSTVLNYVDRQALSILARTVQDDMGLTDRDYASVIQAFLLAYTLAYLFVGRVTDKIGVKWSLAIFVAWWSIANAMTGLVRGFQDLWAARFALGLGEAGNYTVGPKAIAEQFEPKQRAFAYGVYTAGAMVGATIAPPLIGWLAISYGWRFAFFATGALGTLWLVCWLLFYRDGPRPDRQVTVRPEKRESEWAVWRSILGDRSIWALIIARMLTDPLWYFYLFWFPKYLTDERGFTLLALAQTVWIVYLAADVGSIGGGWLSDRLVRKGCAPAAARWTIMRGAAFCIPVGALVALQPPMPFTFALVVIVALCQMGWQINLGSLIIERYPQRKVASIFGAIAAGAGLGGIASTWIVGELVSEFSYAPIFLLMALLHPTALLAVRLVGGRNGLTKGASYDD